MPVKVERPSHGSTGSFQSMVMEPTLARNTPSAYPTFEYLREVVQTAELEGYYSLLIPTRLFDERAPLAETWSTAAALAAVTSRIRFLVAVIHLARALRSDGRHLRPDEPWASRCQHRARWYPGRLRATWRAE